MTKESAKLGSYETLSLPYDHTEMCKFASKDDTGYKRISGILKRWTRMLAEPMETEKPKEVSGPLTLLD